VGSKLIFRTQDKTGLWQNKDTRVQPTQADTPAWWLLHVGGRMAVF